LSSNKDGSWEKPESINNINSKFRESSASITEDGTLLIFSSDRPEGFGGTDLYYSRKELDGDWTTPENIGGYINTKFDEDGPFIHPDGNKLYFSSKGHNTMGGFDIFYSEFLEEKNRWTRPRNMGYPVNSPDDDVFFIWSVDGERAYFSSERADTYGNTDIYIMMRNDKNNVLVNINGKILDKIDQSPVGAEIIVRDVLSNKLIGIFDADINSGSFSVALNSGRKYTFIIKTERYRDEIIQFDIPPQPNTGDLIKNVTLTRKK
jgi:hypothetical protein